MRLHLAQDLRVILLFSALDDRVKADALAVQTALDDFVQSLERAAADEENVARVDLNELLVRMLASALRRNVRDRALDDLQQRLLHALAGDVARNRGILALAGDLVDLVNVDDAALGELHVVIRRLQKTQEDILHIVADVARLGERGRVRDGERHLEDAGERLGKERLAAAGGTEQQDVALLQLHVVSAAEEDALIVVVDRHAQRDLGLVLSDHILVEHGADLVRGGDLIGRIELVLLGLIAVLHDLHAQPHALVTDAHTGGALDHAVRFLLRLAAERAAEKLLLAFFFTHSCNDLSLYRY